MTKQQNDGNNTFYKHYLACQKTLSSALSLSCICPSFEIVFCQSEFTIRFHLEYNSYSKIKFPREPSLLTCLVKWISIAHIRGIFM